MSFLGSIGHLMTNTGLHEVLETIYARNTIEHMMSGKAISRAIRGHLIVDAVLNGLLLKKALKELTASSTANQHFSREGSEVPIVSESPVSTEELDQVTIASSVEVQVPGELQQGEMEEAYQQMMDGKPVEDLFHSEVVQKTKELLDSQKANVNASRTAKLWIQYMKTVDILKQFLGAYKHLNKRVCPSVRPYVPRSVRPSVCRSVRNAFSKTRCEYAPIARCACFI